MSEFELTFSDKAQQLARRCQKHRYARDDDFIEVEIKSTGKKVIRCRLCEFNKEAAKQIREQRWLEHKKNMSDYYIKRVMALRNPGLKMEDISKDVVETKRAVLQIKKVVDDLNKPLKICKKHGDLFKDDVNKSEIRNGVQKYKCKKCQKEWAVKHYQTHKTSVSLKHQEYKKKNVDKVRNWRQNWAKSEKGKAYRQQKEALSCKELKDWYIKKLIAKRRGLIGLSHANIPKALVEIKRASQQLKREIKFKLTGEKNEK